MAKNTGGYAKYAAEASERNKKRLLELNAEIASRVSELEKELGTVFTIKKPTDRHILYIAEQRGREIRIGGSLEENIKKIIMIDTIKNNIIYNGNFTDSASAYSKILKVYGMRTNKQSGFRTKI